ncbi:MAG TPA: hypothetical protein VHW23_31075, partial [Kofleriaceae bacterium]|nr:hypothetical protein [Kofleriaceae bacterium]
TPPPGSAGTPPPDSADTPTPLSSFAAELQRSCPATLDRARAAALRAQLPALIIECWCRPKDPAHAHAAFDLLASKQDREAVRRACKRFEVEL